MTLEEMRAAISKLHAGASYVVVYKKKIATTDGSEAYKITHKPCRLGVRYSNLRCMAGKKAQPLPGNGQWVIDRYVYKDSNGYKLRITNGAFGKARSTYIGDESKIIKQPSGEHKPIVQCICLENVLSILKNGEEL